MGARIVEKVPAKEGLRVYKFRKKEGNAVYIAWSDKKRALLELDIPSKNASIEDVFGKKIHAIGVGPVKCWVDGSPIYIEEKETISGRGPRPGPEKSP